MTTYLIRRFFLACLTLFVITTLVYALIRGMPGSPLLLSINEDPNKKMSEEDREILNRAYGLDKPWYLAYWGWLGDISRLEFGTSFQHRKPVKELISERLGKTLMLSVPSFLATYALAIPIGLFVTRRSGKLDERILSVLFYMLYSMPTYVLSLWLLYLFYLKLEGTPFQLLIGDKSNNFEKMTLLEQIADLARHMILPLFAYSYHGLAYDTRFIKANMEEAIRQDYIRTARAKGLSDRVVLFRHAFRNTLIPFVTLIGLSLPSLIGGAIIIERIFSWPGIGNLYFGAVSNRDYPVIMGLTLIFTIATLLGQLLADVLYAFVDPRVTLE